MRKTITTFADLQAYTNSSKKYLFEVEPLLPVAGFAAVVGKNYYRRAWTAQPFSDTGVSRVQIDGVDLTAAADLATCNSTAGSWALDGGYLYVHTAGADDPDLYFTAARVWQAFATHNGCIFQPSGWLYPVPYEPLIAEGGLPAFMARDDDIVDQADGMAIGQLVLLNGKHRQYSNAGPLDASLKTLIYTRARCRCLIGGEQLPYSEYQLYWSGWVDTVEQQGATVSMAIKDGLQALGYKFPPDIYLLNRKALYEFDSGALTADSSGNSHTLTAIGSPTEGTGKFNGCAVLDGSAAYSAADHADFKPTVPFEVAAWVKKASAPPAVVFIFQSLVFAESRYAGYRLGITASTGVAYFKSGKNTGNSAGVDWAQVIGATDICDNEWHFVQGIWNGTQLQLLVDGISDATPVAWAYAPAYQATNYVRIGCGCVTGTNELFLTGSIDRTYIMHEKLQPNAEGATIPTIYGPCRNIKPMQTNVWSWLFQCASHELHALSAVREAGIDITGNIGTLTLADAEFDLSAYAEGKTITCDVEGKPSGGAPVETYGAIALELLAATPGLVAADIDSTAFSDFDTSYPYTLCVAIEQASAVKETLKLMNASVMARLVKGRNGKLKPVRFGLPAATAAATFTRATMNDLTFPVSQQQLYYKVRLGYEKNHFVQSDTAANGVVERQDWSHDYRWVEKSNPATKYRYGCEDMLTIETLLADQADAETVAAAYLALLQQPWLLIEFISPVAPYSLDIGNTIEINDSRFFASGSMFVITALVDDPATSRVRISAKAPCDGAMTLL